MLANHTCMSQLFTRSLQQFDRIRKRNAFVDNYRKEPMFADNLDEFEDSREVVASLIEEYKACESPNYINWGMGGAAAGGEGAGGAAAEGGGEAAAAT
ncbi:unnamed protein product [Ectocarpus sp. CCAP 1310/34]|nr:unnamed protein product [Ectocarpus sp. CCAP 1310/34]